MPSAACVHVLPAASAGSPPISVPIVSPASSGHRRRSNGPNDGPSHNCHTLVMNDGTSSRLAAADGGIASVSSPIAIVGSPRPIMPLTAPASRKTSTMIVSV